MSRRNTDSVSSSFPQQPSSQPVPSAGVEIPALHAHEAKRSKKGRTTHACEACRRAKAGCSGDRPCTRCWTTRLSCIYGDGKRDRERKELFRLRCETKNLVTQNSEVRKSLSHLRFDSNLTLEGLKTAIDGLLEQKSNLSSAIQWHLSPSEQSQSDEEEYKDNGDKDTYAEVGSNGPLNQDAVDEDQEESRRVGHFVKSAVASWQHRTEELVIKALNEDGHSHSPRIGLTTTYHTEDADLQYFDMSNVSIYGLPAPSLSDALIQLYFDNIHDAFPILDKADFLSRYRLFHGDVGFLSPTDSIWLASLNCVFAIASYQGRLMKNIALGNANDHLIYCARFTALSLQHDSTPLQDSGMKSVSILGLLALYHLTTSRINEAWKLCGMAIRQAISLGLQLRCVSDQLSNVEKENRVRAWWALYSMECTLSEITGRPACIADGDISTPFPMKTEEADLRSSQNQSSGCVQSSRTTESSRYLRDSSNPDATYQMPTETQQQIHPVSPSARLQGICSTSFIFRIQLTIISHETITDLYCAATAKKSWTEIEEIIRRIDSRLLFWAANLPSESSVDISTQQVPNIADLNSMKRTGLAIQYNASRMVLFRSCLYPIGERVRTQSELSKQFNQACVAKCISSARTIIGILSWFIESPQQIFSISPFWNIIHHLCEAVSVLMLELVFGCKHLPQDKLGIVVDIKRGVRCLLTMSGESISAYKAWEIYDKLTRGIATSNNISVNDMTTHAPVPPGYNLFKLSDMEQRHSQPFHPPQ